MDEPEDLRSIEEAVRGRYAALERRVYRPELLGDVLVPRRHGSSRGLWLVSAAAAAAVVAAVAGGVFLLAPGRHVAELSAGSRGKTVSSGAPTTPSAIDRPSLVPMKPTPTGSPSSKVSPPPTGSRSSTGSPAPTSAAASGSGVVALVRQGPIGQAALSLLQALPAPGQLESGVIYRPSALDTTQLATAMGFQVCDPTVVGPVPNALWPIVGTTASAWSRSASLTASGVTFTVTRWASGADGWKQLYASTGQCRLFHATPLLWPGRGSDYLLAQGHPDSGVSWGAMEHVGDYVVSVAYSGADSAHVRSEAMRLADIVAANLRARG